MENPIESLEILLGFINLFAYNLIIIIPLGILYILVLEFKTVVKIFKNKKNITYKKLLAISFPILKRLAYLLGGIVLFFMGFMYIRFLDSFLGSSVTTAYTEIGNRILTYSGVFGVLAFQFAGIVLILSAGGRWMVNLAKLIVTLTTAYLVIVLLLAAARLI